MQYNERIRNLREDNDLTQKEMGKILNVSQRTISHWESGKREPEYKCLIKYALYFNTTTDYILGLSDKKEH